MPHAPKSVAPPPRPEPPPPTTLAPETTPPVEAPAQKPTRIQISDRVISRLAPHPKDVRDLAVKLLSYLYDAGVTSPLGSTTFPVDTHRGVEAADRALAQPPVEDRRGKTPSFGSLAILRPGIGNFGPSGALVFRLSLYAERVIIAYANGLDARFNHLRPAMSVSAVPVPPELRGRLLEIGKPDRLMLSLEQASDLFVEQFAAMKGSPLLGDVDPLAAGALVVAHSTGGLDAPLTRRRLAEAGFPNAISRIIALATPFKGSTVISESLATFITALAGAKMNSDEGRKAVRSIDPKNVQKRVPREVAPLVDVSLAARIGPPPKFRQGKKGAVEAIANEDIRPMLRFVASGSPVKTIGDLKAERVVSVLKSLPAAPVQTDGLVPVESTKFGRKSVVLTEPHDHAGLFEDPDLIDRAIKALIS